MQAEGGLRLGHAPKALFHRRRSDAAGSGVEGAVEESHQQQAGGETLGGGRHERAQPVAAGPVPDLVVVLHAHDEPVAGQAVRHSAVPAADRT